MSKCIHDDNLIVWDDDRGVYLCEACFTPKCPDCGTILPVFDESTGNVEVYCGRCDAKREEIMMGRLLR